MLDVVSRLWLSTVVSAEECSTQVEVAFTDALIADGKAHLLDAQLIDELHAGPASSRTTTTAFRCCSRSATTARR